MTPSKKTPLIPTLLSLLWLMVLPLLSSIYGLLNHPGEHVVQLVTGFDRWTPFVPVFVLPYLLWYLYVPAVLVGLAFKDKIAYYRTLLALCGGLVLSYLVYALFQTTVPRPEGLTDTGILNRLVGWVYAHDRPFNCFPSIHVVTSYLMWRSARVFRPGVRGACMIMSMLIILSTLLLKQHVLADVAGGILVGEWVFRSARKRHSTRSETGGISVK